MPRRRRGSHQEALTALEAAFAEDPEDDERRTAMAEHLDALGGNAPPSSWLACADRAARNALGETAGAD